MPTMTFCKLRKQPTLFYAFSVLIIIFIAVFQTARLAVILIQSSPSIAKYNGEHNTQHDELLHFFSISTQVKTITLQWIACDGQLDNKMCSGSGSVVLLQYRYFCYSYLHNHQHQPFMVTGKTRLHSTKQQNPSTPSRWSND